MTADPQVICLSVFVCVCLCLNLSLHTTHERFGMVSWKTITESDWASHNPFDLCAQPFLYRVKNQPSISNLYLRVLHLSSNGLFMHYLVYFHVLAHHSQSILSSTCFSPAFLLPVENFTLMRVSIIELDWEVKQLITWLLLFFLFFLFFFCAQNIHCMKRTGQSQSIHTELIRSFSHLGSVEINLLLEPIVVIWWTVTFPIHIMALALTPRCCALV